MKAHKLLAILLTSVIPATASAQLVIERLNEDVDPTAPIVKPPEGEATTETEEEEEEEEEEEVESKWTSEETDELHKAFMKQLRSAHTRCLKEKAIQRPALANVSGSATWKISESGKAKFLRGNARLDPQSFFKSKKEYDGLKPEVRKQAEAGADDFYTDCLALDDTRVPIKEKAGEFTVDYTVKWEKNKAVIAINDGSSE